MNIVKYFTGKIFGVPPGYLQSESSESPTVDAEYIAESDLTDVELEAGLSAGTLRPWRRGEGGEQWYQQVADGDLPAIHGVPCEGLYDD